MSTYTTYPTASAARAAGLFWETPLLYSAPLSALCRRNVFLKLDNLQASGSFKDRGVAHLCHSLLVQQQQQQQQQQNKPGAAAAMKFISSSGGNAGLAVATVGKQLNVPVAVIVPETTKAVVVEKLQSLGAEVTIKGENWNQADVYTRQLVEKSENAYYISPYDHPLLWEGHSSLVEEVQHQLRAVVLGTTGSTDTSVPAAILVSVGGGGLLCGVLQGLARVPWKNTIVVAAETVGADSFAHSWQHQQLIRLDRMDSIATSLGALQVTEVALERAMAHGAVQSVVCTDAEAIRACVSLAHDHRFLVEPACGAALATLYTQRLREPFLKSLATRNGPIVVQVCGGSGVNLDLLMQWKQEYLDNM